MSKRNYWNMARERSLHFLELLRAHAPSITSHYVLEGHAGDPQTVERRTPKCKYCRGYYRISSGHVKVMCACCCHNKKSDITVFIYIHVHIVMVIILGHVYSMFIFLKRRMENPDKELN